MVSRGMARVGCTRRMSFILTVGRAFFSGSFISIRIPMAQVQIAGQYLRQGLCMGRWLLYLRSNSMKKKWKGRTMTPIFFVLTKSQPKLNRFALPESPPPPDNRRSSIHPHSWSGALAKERTGLLNKKEGTEYISVLVS